MRRYIISLLMENEAGALSRVVGLFSARGYNIDSLSVAVTEDPTISRLTLVTHGNEEILEQVTKQLNKLIEVIKVSVLDNSHFVERELLLIKVKTLGKDRSEVLRLAEIFRGNIIDVSEKTYTIEITGSSEKIDSFIKMINKEIILETVRTGASGIGRGEKMLRV